MKMLAKALLRLDGLSHVLAWTKDPVLACKDAASLDFVELPRLRLRFEAKPDGPGGKVCSSFVLLLSIHRYTSHCCIGVVCCGECDATCPRALLR